MNSSLFILVNQQSPIGLPMMSAVSTEAILQRQSNEPNLKFNVQLLALKNNVVFMQSQDIFNALTISAFVVPFLGMAAQNVHVRAIRDIRLGLERQLNLAGVSFTNRFVSDYIFSVIVMLYTSLILYLGNTYLVGMNVEGLPAVLLVNCFSMSAYYQFLVVVKKDMKREKSMLMEGLSKVILEFLLPFFMLFWII